MILRKQRHKTCHRVIVQIAVFVIVLNVIAMYHYLNQRLQKEKRNTNQGSGNFYLAHASTENIKKMNFFQTYVKRHEASNLIYRSRSLLALNSSNETTVKSHSIGDYPKDVFTREQKKKGYIVFHVIGVCYMFLGLALVCDEFFVPALHIISKMLKISDDVAGATFMAAGGSAPELFTSVIGVFFTTSNVGFGTIVGSAVFNVLFVIGMCAIFSKVLLQLTWWPLLRDCLFYIIALITLIIAFSDTWIKWWEALLMFLIYIAYVTFMVFNERIEKKVKSYLFRRLKTTNSVTPVDDKDSQLILKLSASISQNSFRHGAVQLVIHTLDPIAEASLEHKFESIKTHYDENSLINENTVATSPTRSLLSHNKTDCDSGSGEECNDNININNKNFRDKFTNTSQEDFSNDTVENKHLSKFEDRRDSEISFKNNEHSRSIESANRIIKELDTVDNTSQEDASNESLENKHLSKREDRRDSEISFKSNEHSGSIASANRIIKELDAIESNNFNRDSITSNGSTGFKFTETELNESKKTGNCVGNKHYLTDLETSAVSLRNSCKYSTDHEDCQENNLSSTYSIRDSVRFSTKHLSRASSRSSFSSHRGLRIVKPFDTDYSEKSNLPHTLEEEDGPVDLTWPDTLLYRIFYIIKLPLLLVLMITLPDVRRPRLWRLFPVTFAVSIFWIAGFTYLMVWWTAEIGDTAGIHIDAMGVTFLAAGTSIPDLITSVVVARQGLGDMAVSSSIGSNIFDVTVGLPLPWMIYSFYKGMQPINVQSDGLFCSTILLFLMLIAVVITIAFNKWKMTKVLGLTMFFLYLIFITVTLLMLSDYIPCPF